MDIENKNDYYQSVVKFSWMYELWQWADKYKIDDLKVLDYNYNCNQDEYRGIPRNKEMLLKMKNLNLSHYDLDEIPEAIGDLPNLVCLNLDANKLTELPYNLCNLEHLENLSIVENRLTKLEEDFSFLKKLHRINIAGNNMKKVPEKLLQFTASVMN